MKHPFKKSLAMLLVFVMMIGILPAVHAADHPFTDVKDQWFAEYVNDAYYFEPQLMNGMTATTFEPEASCTRAMAAVVLYRYENPDPDKVPESTFPDLDPNMEWYQKGIGWAQAEGIVKGHDTGKFAPSDNVTREQMVTMVYRYAGSPKAADDYLKDFPDGSSVSSYAVDAMNWAISQKIIQGDEKKNLNPQDNITRAEFAKVIVVYARTEAPEAALSEDDIVILHTNDIHCHIDKELTYGKLAALKKNIQKKVGEKGGVLLVDAGDTAQGTPYGSMDKGETIINLMRLAGYDAATLGNHEFDYAMKRALEITQQASDKSGKYPGTPFPYLCSNFHKLNADGTVGENVLDSYKIFDLAGKKVAVLGIATPESYTKSTPAYFMDEKQEKYIYGIAGGKDGKELYAAVQKAIDGAKADGADLVVAIAHIGVDQSSKPWTADDIVGNTSGIDVFIDGHSHTEEIKTIKDMKGKEVQYSQTGCHFDHIGMVTIHADGTVQAEYVDEVHQQDPETKKATEDWMADIETRLGKVVAKSEVDFVIKNPETGKRMVRSEETNLGDFTTDALRWYFSEKDPISVGDGKSKPVDFAIMNGGGIRADMPAGDISYKTCMTVHTFGNMATVISLSGQDVLDALEWGSRNAGTGEECGGFLQTSGLTYEIHTYIPNTCTTDEKGNWTGHTGEYRVKNVKIGGEDLDLTATYTMAGQGYTLKSGGDGFTMFKGCPYPKDEVKIDYEVLVEYAKAFPAKDGVPTITADNSPLKADYSNIKGEGRIVLVTEKP